MKSITLATILVMLGIAASSTQATAQNDEKKAAADLAERVCSNCHGPDGNSVSPVFPRLAGQQAEYLAAQIKAFRDHSRADPHAQAYMWGMAAQLTDPTIKALAAYYAAQKPTPGAGGDPAESAKGKAIFENGVEATNVPACQGCHGEKAEGSGVVPRLAGQHRNYLEKQLEAFASNLRANEIMHENSKNMTALQISEVAAYLSGLKN